MVDAALAGNDEEADRLDAELRPLFEALFIEPNPIPVKGALSAMWDRVGDPRLPLIPASAETIEQVEASLGVASDEE